MKKKTIALLLVMMMIFGISVGGTIAYLTSTATVTNIFTVGKIAIILDETKTNENGDAVAGADKIVGDTTGDKGNAYKLMPGHTYTKDPTIHVQPKSEASWLFVKVENGISAIEDSTNKIANQITTTNGWKQLTDANGSDVANVYYKEAAATGENETKDYPIFGSFKVSGTADTTGYESAVIKVTGYAVQKDGFESSAYSAWVATFGAPVADESAEG